MDILQDTDFDFLGRKISGKVRDIYDQGDRLILVTTDRHSSFDRIIAHVPWKGQVLNQISAWWFEKTKDIVPNHVLAIPDPNATVARKCTMVPIEAVVRGYLTGVTDTAIWTRYGKGQRNFGGVALPDGMKKNQKLPQPIFDPTTKETEHDRVLEPEQMIAEGFVSQDLFDRIKATAMALFARGQDLAARSGLILVDTKYEFGTDTNGGLVLIDEIHTPDLSRYWWLDSTGPVLQRARSRNISIRSFCGSGSRIIPIRTATQYCLTRQPNSLKNFHAATFRSTSRLPEKSSHPARRPSCRGLSKT